MPIYESACGDPQCRMYCVPQEHFYHVSQPLNACEACGGETYLLASRFAVVFTGPIGSSKYCDTKLESYTGEDGFWVTEKKDTPDGKPQQRYITTWEERRQWMRREGLVDVGNQEPTPDGKLSSSRAGQGMPGAWV